MYGLTAADLDSAEFEVWPENAPAVNAFVALSTQWRVGMAGPTGLDYAAIEPVLRMQGVPRREWADLFEGVRVMEAEALAVMAEARKR